MCCPAGVWRLMGDVWSVSELNAFCPLMCAVTMETGVFAGTTEMAMLWLGGLIRARGLAVVPTGQLLTASFCCTKHKQQVINPETADNLKTSTLD